MTNLVAGSIPRNLVIVFKCHFLFKKIKGTLGEIADARSVAGNV